jgi:DNA-binding transcriptional regulator YiaG
MYHYTDCGLDYVWLENGYKEIDTPYGRAVSIENVDRLHKRIGLAAVKLKKSLSGADVRFLRKEMDFSQSALGDLLGVDEQTVARWEKLGRINAPEDRLLRALFVECMTGKAAVRSIADQVSQRASQTGGSDDEPTLRFEERNNEWRESIAA